MPPGAMSKHNGKPCGEGSWCWKFNQKGTAGAYERSLRDSSWPLWRAVKCQALVLRVERSPALSEQVAQQMIAEKSGSLPSPPFPHMAVSPMKLQTASNEMAESVSGVHRRGGRLHKRKHLVKPGCSPSGDSICGDLFSPSAGGRNLFPPRHRDAMRLCGDAKADTRSNLQRNRPGEQKTPAPRRRSFQASLPRVGTALHHRIQVVRR
jgi:hypothetical protein